MCIYVYKTLYIYGFCKPLVALWKLPRVLPNSLYNRNLWSPTLCIEALLSVLGLLVVSTGTSWSPFYAGALQNLRDFVKLPIWAFPLYSGLVKLYHICRKNLKGAYSIGICVWSFPCFRAMWITTKPLGAAQSPSVWGLTMPLYGGFLKHLHISVGKTHKCVYVQSP